MKATLPIAATAAVFRAQSAETAAGGQIRRALMRLASGNHVLAWTDQAIVSATSFASLVMIGRWTNSTELGVYSVGLSALALLLGVHEALITRPYAIQLHRPQGTPAEHAFGALMLSLLLAAAAALTASATAVTLSALGANEQLTGITWALAATLPFVLAREFARRFGFAHLQISRAFVVDLIAAALNLAVLGWLGWRGELSAITGLIAVAVSCAAATAVWLYRSRTEFAFRLDHFKSTLQQSWNLGKWLLCGQIAMQAQGYVTTWLALLISGATVTGVYAACVSIVAFANPVLFGFYNILTPRSVHILKSEGATGLRRQAARDGLLLAAIMTGFCLVIYWAGDDVMRFLYPGAEYRGHSNILTLLALATFAAATGAPASIGLATAERGRAVAAVMTATALLNVALVWAMLTLWGLPGAAYAVLITEVVGSVSRWTAFLALVPALDKARPI